MKCTISTSSYFWELQRTILLTALIELDSIWDEIWLTSFADLKDFPQVTIDRKLTLN